MTGMAKPSRKRTSNINSILDTADVGTGIFLFSGLLDEYAGKYPARTRGQTRFDKCAGGEGTRLARTRYERVRIQGRELRVSNLDKVLWPGDGLTKADLMRYYLEVAPVLLPHLKDRLMVFTRYPEGALGAWFYQKNAPPGLPEWIRTFPFQGSASERVINYILLDEPAALAWVANQACIEIHPWMSRCDGVNYPDFAIFDLDPAEPATYEDAREVAFLIKRVLDEFGLQSYPKTSGATGLHLYVPVDRVYTYQDTCHFVELVARLILKAYPERVTLERAVAARAGKVYIDYLQNIRGKTITSVYGPRPRSGATVSTPVTWEELSAIDPASFTVTTVPQRLSLIGDIFSPVIRGGQRIDGAIAQLR